MNPSNLFSAHSQSFEFNHDTQLLRSLLANSHLQHDHQPSNQDDGTADARWLTRSPAENLRTVMAIRPEHFQLADNLIRRRYTWRGYQVSPTDDTTRAAEKSDLRPVTLLAETRGQLLATLTVRPDSSNGLLAEQSYGDVVASLRQKGQRVGELVKLAVEEGVDWKAALDALVQSAYLVTRVIYALTHVLIEVNPRHVRFYERVFGFFVAAAERMCTRAGAPSVLMQLDLIAFGERLQLRAA